MSVFLPTRFIEEDPLLFGGNVVDSFEPIPTGWSAQYASFGQTMYWTTDAVLLDGSPFLIPRNVLVGQPKWFDLATPSNGWSAVHNGGDFVVGS